MSATSASPSRFRQATERKRSKRGATRSTHSSRPYLSGRKRCGIRAKPGLDPKRLDLHDLHKLHNLHNHQQTFGLREKHRLAKGPIWAIASWQEAVENGLAMPHPKFYDLPVWQA